MIKKSFILSLTIYFSGCSTIPLFSQKDNQVESLPKKIPSQVVVPATKIQNIQPLYSMDKDNNNSNVENKYKSVITPITPPPVSRNLTTKRVELVKLESLANAQSRDLISQLSSRIDILEKNLLDEKMLRETLTQELYQNSEELKIEVAKLKKSTALLSYRVNEIIISLNKVIENNSTISAMDNSINGLKMKDYERLISELSQHNRMIYDKLYILEKRLNMLER